LHCATLLLSVGAPIVILLPNVMLRIEIKTKFTNQIELSLQKIDVLLSSNKSRVT
jgi:hypothetical protein